MNISKFVVLGALEALETASGYDIIRFLEKKMISSWANIKNGSIYNSLKSLTKSGDIIEVDRVKKGLFPTMTLYEITDQGRQTFDNLQEEAFMGLYPLYLGFKLGLKFNRRRTHDEIRHFAQKAMALIDQILQQMDAYMNGLPPSSNQKISDTFFIEHDRMLLLEEKRWIQMVVKKLDTAETAAIDGL